MKCCDLIVGLAEEPPPAPAAPSPYGLLWADPEGMDSGFEGTGGWREEDVSLR